MEVWVRPNRRAIVAGCVPPLLVALILSILGWWTAQFTWWLGLGCGLAAGCALALATTILMQLAVPRITHEPGSLYLYVGKRSPLHLPTSNVECFFVGQAPSEIGKADGAELKHRNLIVRLAERATDWQYGDMKRSIGEWRNGYITINGIWCEPIDAKLVSELNRQLVMDKRNQKSLVNPENEQP